MTFVTTIERLETGLLIWIDNHRYRKTIKLLIQLLRRPRRMVLCLVAICLFFWTMFELVVDCMANSQQVAEVLLVASAGVVSVTEAVQ